MVGIANGKKGIGLELSADISFEVEENIKDVKKGWKEVWDRKGDTVELTVNKVWENDSESIRPEYVKVQLLKDNVVYGVATLNEANDWTYTWEKLDADSEWSVRESEIPRGYEVEIDEDNGNFIITNTYKTDPDPTDPTDPETTTPAWVDDDDEPETTVPPTTVPETSAPVLETTPVEPTSPTVIYRGVEIPQEILDQYPGRTLDELFDMGVLGAFFENVPTGLLPATGEHLSGWSILAIISAIGLAILTLFDKKRKDV